MRRQVHLIKRRLGVLMPSMVVFLDVDNLSQFDQLTDEASALPCLTLRSPLRLTMHLVAVCTLHESAAAAPNSRQVLATEVVLLFLSRGYFSSRACHIEYSAAAANEKPCLLVHEADQNHGGGVLPSRPLNGVLRPLLLGPHPHS